MLGSNTKETPDGGFEGRTMTIEAFARKYRLDEEEAHRLEEEFGSSAAELVCSRLHDATGFPRSEEPIADRSSPPLDRRKLHR